MQWKRDEVAEAALRERVLVGEDAVRKYIVESTSASLRKDYYEKSIEVILGYWASLALFALVCAILATISLEFIDKDKR